MKATTARIASFGPYTLDLRSGELRKYGTKVKMGEQSFTILCMLLENPGEMVTRDELRAKLWADGTFVDFDRGLNSAVQRLRDCLSDLAGKLRWVKTLPRRGYRFIGEVAWSEEDSSQDNKQPKGREVSRPRARFVTAAVLVAVAAVITGWVSIRPAPSPKIVRTVQLTSDGVEKLGPVVTDGLRIYFSEHQENWGVASVPVSGGEVVSVPLPFRNARMMNISPDKSDLLVGEGSPFQEMPLWRVPTMGGSPRRLGDLLGHDASWSPDGQSLALANAGSLYLAKADGTGPSKLVSGDSDPSIWVWSPTWSPDGKRLRFEQYNMNQHTSVIREFQEGRPVRSVFARTNDTSQSCCGAWSRDGKY